MTGKESETGTALSVGSTMEEAVCLFFFGVSVFSTVSGRRPLTRSMLVLGIAPLTWRNSRCQVGHTGSRPKDNPHDGILGRETKINYIILTRLLVLYLSVGKVPQMFRPGIANKKGAKILVHLQSRVYTHM